MVITRYRVPTAVALAMCGFIVSWVLIHHGWFSHKLMLDTTVYAHYAGFMKRGLVPYLDFKFEYPPLAALVFLVPGWIAGQSWHLFEQSFELIMLAMGLVTVGVGAWLLARDRVSPARLAAGIYIPFLAIAPHGVAWSLRDQGTRPLQIESAAASLWLAAHQVLGLHLKLFFSHGSDNLYGHPPTTAASAMTIVQWLVIALVWVTFALGKATKERLVLASAAAVCAFLFLGRVLSPQYLIWLVPLVMIAPGRRGF